MFVFVIWPHSKHTSFCLGGSALPVKLTVKVGYLGVSSHRALSKDCQMLLFSATFEESLWEFAERVIPEPNIIRLRREEETLDNIKQFYVSCKNKEDKLEALYNLYGTLTVAQAIVFCHVSPAFLPGTLCGVCLHSDPE